MSPGLFLRTWPERRIEVGPFVFALRSPLPEVMRQLDWLYRDYPRAGGIADFSVALAPSSRVRRFFRPQVRLACDVEVPDLPPMPRRLGALAVEMGMNLQIAAGMNRLLLLHAAAVERQGGALLILGDSGAGKSTLAAHLAYSGWRLLGDEFALVEPESDRLYPFPRPISLKNGSIPLLRPVAPPDRFGPLFTETLKGRIRHLLPPLPAIRAMHRTARIALIVEAGFAEAEGAAAEPLDPAETFVKLSQSSTNFQTLGEAGFRTLWKLVDGAPAYRLRYPSSAEAAALLERLWTERR